MSDNTFTFFVILLLVIKHKPLIPQPGFQSCHMKHFKNTQQGRNYSGRIIQAKYTPQEVEMNEEELQERNRFPKVKICCFLFNDNTIQVSIN